MLLKETKGAAVVEFALVLPLFLLLVFGIIEFGFLLYNQAMLTNAAREGARAGITIQPNGSRLSTDDVITVVNDYLCPPTTTSCDSLLVSFSSSATAPHIETKVNGTEADPGDGMTGGEDFLTVEVTYDYDFLVVPALITNLGVRKTLFASTTMMAE